MLLFASVPFVLWGTLVVIARWWKPNLRGTLPWLRVFRWLASALGTCTVAFAAFGPYRYFWLLPIGMGIGSISSGSVVVERWVKRQYAPELLAPKSDRSLPVDHN